MATKKKCETVNCENEPTPKTPNCKQCNASINSWMKRKPGEVLTRRSNLRRYSGRMDNVMEERGIDEKA